MSKDSLTSETLDSIRRYIDSLEELEILLLFMSTGEQHSPEDVNESLRSSLPSIQSRIKQLVTKGFLAESGPDKYIYKPQTPELADTADNISVAYKERRIKVIEAIFTKPLAGIREFAEAFKFKGGKDE